MPSRSFVTSAFRPGRLAAAAIIIAFLLVATFIVLAPKSRAGAIAELGASSRFGGPGGDPGGDAGGVPEAVVSVAALGAPAQPLEAVQPRGSGRVSLVADAMWDAVTLANVREALALLPDSVQAQLGNPALGPVLIQVNSEGRASSGAQPYGRAANFFSTNDGKNEVVLYPQQSVFTVLHELGHAYNLRLSPGGNYASVLTDDEMRSFMAVAGWQVLTPLPLLAGLRDSSQAAIVYSGGGVWPSMSREDPLEDFANSFALFFLDPDALERRSADRYAWFAARFGK